MKKILSIETSCDETALSYISFSDKNKEGCIPFSILNNEITSQIDLMREFGGVYPTIAKREHQKSLPLLLLKLLKEHCEKTDTQISDDKKMMIKKILDKNEEMQDIFIKEIVLYSPLSIDRIAVTVGPGLAPALYVGVNFCKVLSYLWGVPIIPVNHMEGHLVSPFIENDVIREPQYPLLSLLVSGGHTELVLKEKQTQKIGRTLDDAVGEAFDKVGRMLGLPYPGGPEISKLSTPLRESKSDDKYDFPRPMEKSNNLDFSYSGLKTKVRYQIEKMGSLTDQDKNEISYSFENAAIDILISKTRKAIETYNPKTLSIGGGVSANSYLRDEIIKLGNEFNISTKIPDIKLSGDNAIMIGVAGYLNYDDSLFWQDINVDSNLSI